VLVVCWLNNPDWLKTTTTTTTPTVLRPFVRDYPGEPVPEETLTHPPSWSSSNLYQLLLSTTIHSILPVQITCLAVFLHNFSNRPRLYLWSLWHFDAIQIRLLLLLIQLVGPLSVYCTGVLPVPACCVFYGVCVVVMKLFIMSMHIQSPAVLECISLPCLRILQHIINPSPPASKKNKVHSVYTLGTLCQSFKHCATALGVCLPCFDTVDWSLPLLPRVGGGTVLSLFVSLETA